MPPDPVSVMDCGLPGALSVTESVPVVGPAAVGNVLLCKKADREEADQGELVKYNTER